MELLPLMPIISFLIVAICMFVLIIGLPFYSEVKGKLQEKLERYKYRKTFPGYSVKFTGPEGKTPTLFYNNQPILNFKIDWKVGRWKMAYRESDLIEEGLRVLQEMQSSKHEPPLEKTTTKPPARKKERKTGAIFFVPFFVFLFITPAHASMKGEMKVEFTIFFIITSFLLLVVMYFIIPRFVRIQIKEES